MEPEERDWLMRMSAQMAGRFEKPTIVQIGVQYGASLACSLAGAPEARIVGVDLNIGFYEGPPGPVLMQANSKEYAPQFLGPVHLLFVDGDHTRDGVHGDMQGWLGKVRPGGLAVFHDYRDIWQDGRSLQLEGVAQAVNAWNWADSTWENVPAPGSLFAMRRRPFLKRGDGFGTLALGTPFLKDCYHFFRWWSWLLVGGLEDGDQLLNDESFDCPQPIPMAHNAIIQRFLATDRDTLCIVEDDHVGPQAILRDMRNKPENLDFDIVCANYVNRRGLPVPMGYMFAGLEGEEMRVQIDCANTATTGTQELDGAAMGLLLIRRWVLDAMLNGADPAIYQWCEWRGRNSQDIWFYWKAHQVGARCGVDRDARLGHIGERVWTFEDFVIGREKARKELAEQAKQKAEMEVGT